MRQDPLGCTQEASETNQGKSPAKITKGTLKGVLGEGDSQDSPYV